MEVTARQNQKQSKSGGRDKKIEATPQRVILRPDVRATVERLLGGMSRRRDWSRLLESSKLALDAVCGRTAPPELRDSDQFYHAVGALLARMRGGL